MTTSDPFQADIARLALAVARKHGFALAGGHALIAHGIINRPTQDIDLFADETSGVQAAAELGTTVHPFRHCRSASAASRVSGWSGPRTRSRLVTTSSWTVTASLVRPACQ